MNIKRNELADFYSFPHKTKFISFRHFELRSFGRWSLLEQKTLNETNNWETQIVISQLWIRNSIKGEIQFYVTTLMNMNSASIRICMKVERTEYLKTHLRDCRRIFSQAHARFNVKQLSLSWCDCRIDFQRITLSQRRSSLFSLFSKLLFGETFSK